MNEFKFTEIPAKNRILTYRITDEDMRRTFYELDWPDTPYFEKLNSWLHKFLHKHFGRKYCGSWIFRVWPSRRVKSKFGDILADEIRKEIDNEIISQLNEELDKKE